jgi:uncharacterized membrane protein
MWITPGGWLHLRNLHTVVFPMMYFHWGFDDFCRFDVFWGLGSTRILIFLTLVTRFERYVCDYMAFVVR